MALTTGQLKTRLHQVARHLEHWGDLRARDDGITRRRALLAFDLAVPARDVSPDVRALYREYYDRDRTGTWTLVKYTYEYADLVRSWRLGYHLHSVGDGPPVAHAHCEPGDGIPGTEGAHHFRSLEYDLREADALFMRLYAAGLPPDCDELLPLVVNRG